MLTLLPLTLRSLLWTTPVLESRDKMLLVPRLARLWSGLPDAGRRSAVEGCAAHLPKLYELLASCIPPDVIIRQLTIALLRKVPPGVKHEAVYHASLYEQRMQQGSKPIFHLEAFVACFMSLYKRQLMGAF